MQVLHSGQPDLRTAPAAHAQRSLAASLQVCLRGSRHFGDVVRDTAESLCRQCAILMRSRDPQTSRPYLNFALQLLARGGALPENADDVTGRAPTAGTQPRVFDPRDQAQDMPPRGESMLLTGATRSSARTASLPASSLLTRARHRQAHCSSVSSVEARCSHPSPLLNAPQNLELVPDSLRHTSSAMSEPHALITSPRMKTGPSGTVRLVCRAAGPST